MKNWKLPSLNLAILITFILVGIPVFASYIVPPNGVTTVTIQAGAVTQSKLGARPAPSPSPSPSASTMSIPVGGIAISNPGSIGPSGGGFIPNNSLTITTSGRPVEVGFITSSGSTFCQVHTSDTSTDGLVEFYRNGTLFALYDFTSQFPIPCSAFRAIDIVGAGTYTYTAKIVVNLGTSVTATQVSLYAYEQ